MLSGNGRHRRPRQAPALVVAAGVTGSAIAIPLLGAASAHAADGVTWDRLAQCESDGDWSAESNGHYGGLQMTQEMWVTHGGLDYAVSPDQASRSEQIAVAEKVLATKGPSAWPYCAVLVGLTPSQSPSPSASDGSSSDGATSDDGPSGSASADPDPSASSDATDAPSHSGGSGESSSSSDPTDSPSPSASDDPGASSTGTGGSSHQGGASDGSGSSDGSGRHRGDRAHDRDGRAGEAAGRHASRDGGHADEAYTVRSGDNLWAIARAHDLKGGWPALYAANKETIGDDPDLILPGQRLNLS